MCLASSPGRSVLPDAKWLIPWNEVAVCSYDGSSASSCSLFLYQEESFFLIAMDISNMTNSM